MQPVAGGPARHLTSGRFEGLDGLTWSASGGEVVFATGESAYRVGLEGGDPRPVVLTQGAGQPSIRDSRLVYLQTAPSNLDIWRTPARHPAGGGHGAPRMLIGSSLQEFNPAYAPDGRRIAFESDRSGSNNVWVCRADGSDPVQLTTFLRYAGTPRWSPDGRRITFDSSEAGDWNIYVIDADGGAPRRLTPEVSDEFRATWSPDGRWIYFVSDRNAGARIWRMPSTGGPAVQATRRGGVYAEVSSDGRFLYYADRDTNAAVHRVAVDGGDDVEVVRGPLSSAFDWALGRDGIYYALTQTEAQRPIYGIRFLEFASGRTTELYRQEEPRFHDRLAVSPGGEWVLFAESRLPSSELVLVENFH